MSSKAFAFLGLLFAIVVLMISSEVAARALAQTSTDKNNKVTAETNGVEDAKNGYPGHGDNGGYPGHGDGAIPEDGGNPGRDGDYGGNPGRDGSYSGNPGRGGDYSANHGRGSDYSANHGRGGDYSANPGHGGDYDGEVADTKP